MRNVMKRRRRLGGEPLLPFESDAIAWLDAESLVGVYANGDPVPTWPATINAANGSATQSGVGAIPSFDADVDGSGKAGLAFNGSSHFMILGDAWKLSPTGTYTYYIVAKRSDDNAKTIAAWGAGTTGAYLHQFVSAGRTNFTVGGTFSGNITSPLWTVNTRQALVVTNFASAGGYSVHFNNALAFSNSSNGSTTSANAAVLAGRWNAGSTAIELFLNGTIQCVLAYSTEHDATDRAAVLAFIFERYGVVP